MKLMRLTLACLALGLGVTASADAQAPAVTNTRDLRFRTVLAGYPTTVTRTDNMCGRVAIRGTGNAEIVAQWTLPASIFHTTQGDPMPISFGSDDAGHGDRQNLNQMTGWDPSTTLVVRLSNNGRKYFALGGTVSPAPNQRVGNYQGQIVLTVAYTGN